MTWAVLLAQAGIVSAGYIEHLFEHVSRKYRSKERLRAPTRDINLKCSFTLLSLKLRYLLKYTKPCVHFHRAFSMQSRASHMDLALCPHLVNFPIEIIISKIPIFQCGRITLLIYIYPPWWIVSPVHWYQTHQSIVAMGIFTSSENFYCLLICQLLVSIMKWISYIR